MSNRKQRVGVNGKYSDWFNVDSGVPQGSILGPLLFLIYINDLPDFCTKTYNECVMYLYADDAKVYKIISNSEDQEMLQGVINRLKEWCDKWLVSVNASKCNQVSYTAKHKIDTNYYISNYNTKHFIER